MPITPLPSACDESLCRDSNRKIWRNITLTITMCSLAFCFIGVAMAEPNESVSGVPFVSNPSTDTSPVDIRAAGYDLRIPRNYLETAQVFMGTSIIGIVTTFPDFSGATTSTLDEFQPRNAWSSHNIIEIRRITYISSAAKQINEQAIRTAIQNGGPDAGYGLTKIDGPVITVLVGLRQPIEDSDVISCRQSSQVSDPTRLRCRETIDIAPNLVMDFEYDGSLLPNWHQVRLGVTKLLNSFLRNSER